MYKVEFTRNALKSLKKIDTIYQRLVIEKLEALQENPYEKWQCQSTEGYERIL